jgi:hypothetical protein
MHHFLLAVKTMGFDMTSLLSMSRPIGFNYNATDKNNNFIIYLTRCEY